MKHPERARRIAIAVSVSLVLSGCSLFSAGGGKQASGGTPVVPGAVIAQQELTTTHLDPRGEIAKEATSYLSAGQTVTASSKPTIPAVKNRGGVVVAMDRAHHILGYAVTAHIDGVRTRPVKVDYRSTAFTQFFASPDFLTSDPLKIAIIRGVAENSPHLTAAAKLLETQAKVDRDYTKHPTFAEAEEYVGIATDVKRGLVELDNKIRAAASITSPLPTAAAPTADPKPRIITIPAAYTHHLTNTAPRTDVNIDPLGDASGNPYLGGDYSQCPEDTVVVHSHPGTRSGVCLVDALQSANGSGGGLGGHNSVNLPPGDVRITANNYSTSWAFLFRADRPSDPIAYIGPHTNTLPTLQDIVNALANQFAADLEALGCEVLNYLWDVCNKRKPSYESANPFKAFLILYKKLSFNGDTDFTLTSDDQRHDLYIVTANASRDGDLDALPGFATTVPFDPDGFKAPVPDAIGLWTVVAAVMTTWTQVGNPLAQMILSPASSSPRIKSSNMKLLADALVSGGGYANLNGKYTQLANDVHAGLRGDGGNITQPLTDLLDIFATIVARPEVISAVLAIALGEAQLYGAFLKAAPDLILDLIPGPGWIKTVIEKGPQLLNVIIGGVNLIRLTNYSRYEGYDAKLYSPDAHTGLVINERYAATPSTIGLRTFGQVTGIRWSRWSPTQGASGEGKVGTLAARVTLGGMYRFGGETLYTTGTVRVDNPIARRTGDGLLEYDLSFRDRYNVSPTTDARVVTDNFPTAPLAVEPSTIGISIDSTYFLVDLYWSGWSPDGADAVGQSDVSTCNPNCAGGPRIRKDVKVHLSGVQTIGGHKQFTMLSTDGMPPYAIGPAAFAPTPTAHAQPTDYRNAARR